MWTAGQLLSKSFFSSLPILLACPTSPHNHISQLLATNLFIYLFTNPLPIYITSSISLVEPWHTFSKYESGPRPKSQWTLVRFYVGSIKSIPLSCPHILALSLSHIWHLVILYYIYFFLASEHHFNCFSIAKDPLGNVYFVGNRR